MHRVIAPKLDLQTVEVEIVQWHKREGEWVDKGDVLLEITTEKATVDIEAPEHGKITQVLFSEGENIQAGKTLFVIEPL